MSLITVHIFIFVSEFGFFRSNFTGEEDDDDYSVKIGTISGKSLKNFFFSIVPHWITAGKTTYFTKVLLYLCAVKL